MSDPLDFSGKAVVVVGGTSGINRGIAEEFARRGAKVAVASRSQEKVDATLTALTDAGASEVAGAAFDVRDPQAVADGLSSFHAAFGPFEVLISGAAGNFPALTSEMSVNAFRTVVEIDLMGTVHVMKAAYPLLKRPGASVINISAPQSYLPYEGQAHVCAAKAGVDQITRTLSMEWGVDGIRINSVVPGYIAETEGVSRMMPSQDAVDRALGSIPAGRLGDKREWSPRCLFLGSDMASYISGSLIVVDGAVYQRGSGIVGQEIGEMLRAAITA